MLDRRQAIATLLGDRDDVERIVGAALAEGEAYSMLAELCRVAPNRLTGSPGYTAAAEWARQTMERAGLENVRLETTPAPHWTRGDVGEVRIVEPPELAGTALPMVALGGSVPTPELGLTAEVVAVDGLEAAAELGEAARGRIVLFNGPMDPTRLDTFGAYGGAVGQRVHGASAAARVGAVGALVRSMTTRRDDVPHAGGMRYAADAPRIPTAAISTLAADRLAALLDAGRRVVVHFRQDCRTLGEVPTHNVVGELVGREHPEQVLVVGGHLDAWDVSEGAHDCGGGCCQAIEAARLLRSLDLVPRRTIRVVLFGNEENGLAGGKAYAADHADEMGDHLLALESDRGVFTPRGFTTNANPAARATLEEIVALLAHTGASELRNGGGGADIGPMRAHGVVQVGYLPDAQRYFDLHHTARDTFDEISDREINLGAGVIAALLYVVADLEEPLPRNEPAAR